MSQTVQYKRTLRASVGAGVGALFNGDDRRYFILEHKGSSLYHHAGESQKFIIDQVELGRGGSCQVQFDESFTTVSRRHAVIIREGERWKIVQLSTTNSTLVNGQAIYSERYLENGDEIQLSIGGPRMGFIVPMGRQGLVSSIRMTERLNLFRKQALKPYKSAIAWLAVVLVIGFAGAGFLLWNQNGEMDKLAKSNEYQRNKIDNLIRSNEYQQRMLDDFEKKHIADSIEIEKLKKNPVKIIVDPNKDVVAAVKKVESSVYAVLTRVCVSNGEKTSVATCQGTGFLLDDGRFVTARHCVEPWKYDCGEWQTIYALSRVEGSGFRIWAEIIALNNNGETFKFRSEDFRMDKSYDTPYTVKLDFGGKVYELEGSIGFGSEASLGNDWAYIRTSKRGNILDGKDISQTLTKGVIVHLLGFPKSLGIMDGESIVEPIYNSMAVSRTGLNNGRCIMVSQGIDHGNSGGPVFVMSNGRLKVIGIVSRGDGESEFYNHLIPMSNLR